MKRRTLLRKLKKEAQSCGVSKKVFVEFYVMALLHIYSMRRY